IFNTLILRHAVRWNTDLKAPLASFFCGRRLLDNGSCFISLLAAGGGKCRSFVGGNYHHTKYKQKNAGSHAITSHAYQANAAVDFWWRVLGAKLKWNDCER